MTIWIVLTLMVALVVVALTVPLVRRFDARAAEKNATLAVLADELAEVDAQLARGAVEPREAEGLRTEIKRRMLAEGRAIVEPSRPLATRTRSLMAYSLAGGIALSAVALYALMGRPDLGAERGDPQPRQAAQVEVPPEVMAQVRELEARLQANPTDAEGWRVLGAAYQAMRRFSDAAAAYGRAVENAPQGPGYQSAYGEALTQVAEGSVTPRARAAFQAAVRLDPQDARARYFLGLAKSQEGDTRGALNDWLALLRTAPAGAPWAAEVRRITEQVASEAKVDISAELAALPSPAGPTQEQVAAAQAMSPEDRDAMINQMVEGLAARLKENPRDLAGWERLIRARVVLEQRDLAAQALREARMANPQADVQSRLDALARELALQG